ncbi:GTP-binding protein Rhes-like [Lingula anatina]|uniref:GTP-binding protein Rhes-like n=1 Tax=Lingula anatina TaxID=7574 RepID=A0A1S3JX44_LINAN|nr:GTP-binding protein Rhes-like [Lingula anatina]|eukprot:XP_013415000.1 GTP-binding protein Rhes-like [Lingula anatina]
MPQSQIFHRLSSKRTWEGTKPRSQCHRGQHDKQHFNVVFLGAAKVGKSSIVSRLRGGPLSEVYVPTVEDCHRLVYLNHGEEMVIDVIDTAGYYSFPAMKKLNISNGDAFVLVYSVDDNSSFEEVRKLRQVILDAKNASNVPIVIVGNKSDLAGKDAVIGLSRKISELTASVDWGNIHLKASAKQNNNISQIIMELLTLCNAQKIN